MTNWYRHKTWTKIDEEEFFAKLGRARKDGRAQYLKIQAIELAETKDVELLKVAEILLNKMLNEYPNDNFNKSSALHTLGDIFKHLDNIQKAISYYKQAIDFENVYPKVKTHAYLNYSELIIKTGETKKYNEVEKMLLERYSDLLFQIDKYKVNSILAIINKHYNRLDESKHFAELAEQNANSETSGLRYHKTLGIVTEKQDLVDKLVANE